MSMSKKDYVAIAAAVKETTSLRMLTPDQRWVVKDLAESLAKVFSRDNGAFDRGRFLTACGVKE